MANTKRPLSGTTHSNKQHSKRLDNAAGPPTQAPTPPIADDTIVIDRRTSGERRKSGDRRKTNQPVSVERRQLQRRAKVNRRRQIDPTTCERDYTPEEIEFMKALEAYKRSSGRMFPTCSEILEVLRGLGYEKRAIESPAASCSVGATPEPGPATPSTEQPLPV